MKIECVIVCVNYGDFLAETLKQNLPYLDRVVVVTSYADKETHGVCAKFGVDCVQTNVMYEDGAKFNKGKAITLGLGHCVGDGWLLHLDADVVLPHDFKRLLRHAHLDEHCIYGADRINVIGWDKWIRLRDTDFLHYRYSYFVEPPKWLSVGARIIHKDHGWVPIGYFQLWHGKHHKSYPRFQGSAEHTDVLHALAWDRSHRRLLPTLYVYHLESEACPMGTNWHGRKTKRFGPPHSGDDPPYRP